MSESDVETTQDGVVWVHLPDGSSVAVAEEGGPSLFAVSRVYTRGIPREDLGAYLREAEHLADDDIDAVMDRLPPEITAPCSDCEVETLPTTHPNRAEWYQVTDDVWLSAVPSKEGYILCVGCLEARLGRQLVPGDFTAAPINNPAERDGTDAWTWRTPRLLNRLTGNA
ncbi:hypothetical protein F4561_005400 [Lipingzhangella halophila]|uniref:Uncharacterized protein n=1 Tax=Lipingzhangella halophila TaxID=1783352 RepID=A0A7W7RM80_9ACTN|nr:hypothetical protein [Lipingzhangella halophila]MBB4934580.1 hypothetical protein [Lipingzhangella halophila]